MTAHPLLAIVLLIIGALALCFVVFGKLVHDATEFQKQDEVDYAPERPRRLERPTRVALLLAARRNMADGLAVLDRLIEREREVS